jgi:hypothetical protein
MSVPTALHVLRYRAFERDETLPLRPLTLLYGRNNSGKSALCRALAMIGSSVGEDAGSALAVPSEVLRDGSFTDLAWQGEAGDYSFELGLRWPDGELRDVRYTVDGGSGRPTYVKELVLNDERGNPIWTGRAPPGRPLRRGGQHGGDEVQLTGLVPGSSSVGAIRLLSERMAALRGRVRWIEGVRVRPKRIVERSGQSPTHLASNGSNAAQFLVERVELLEHVKRFYAELTPARELEVKEVLNLGHALTLSPSNRPSFRVDLVDTGEGMAQVLPVLVAATLAAEEGSGSILAVEEPESHLHPDAQFVLANYFCRLAASEAAPTLVLETHSRVFLLGVQLAVAEGRISPESVSLAWVDQDESGRSTITPVELSPSGHPRAGWPPAALGEDLRLAGKLAQLDLNAE